MDRRFEKVESDIGSMRAVMVTKDYLDEKLFKISGEFGFHLRREDEKVDALVGALENQSILTKHESHKLAAMGPFKK